MASAHEVALSPEIPAAVVFARVGGMEVLLDCAAKEALGWGRGGERQSMV